MNFYSRSSDTISDEQIIELYWQRDESAIKETDVKYGQYLYAIAYNILSDKGDCEECLNDTYIGAWNAIPPQRPTLLKAFLATIARRTALNCYKKRRRQKQIPSEVVTSLSELEFLCADECIRSDADTKEIGRIISEFVRSLSPRRMYIFMSRYYLFLPIREITERLGCSESTVNKEIAAIKEELKGKIEKEGYSI